MTVKQALIAGLQLAQLAAAAPSVFFPFNAQLPPAARIDTFFSYTLSPHTFDAAGPVTLSFGDNHPPWLSIESDERRIFGTPKDSDVASGDIVGQQVDIIATDQNGSVAMNATVVISREKAPTIQIPLSKQIQGFGNYSAPSNILAYPSTDFSYSFDRQTWEHQEKLNYYAVSSNNSPLPAWVKFDIATLTFSGKTPPFESLVQPPETFGLKLVASDIVGFAGSDIEFAIVVGAHKLATTNPIITLNATRGSTVTYDGLENGVTLDSKPVQPGDLRATTKDMPEWMTFDSATGRLHGTPDNNAHSTNFTITFSDNHLDSLDVIVVLNVATGLFKTTFTDMQVRPGSKFDVDVAKFLKNPDDITIDVSTEPSENWLKVDGFKLSGTTPKSGKGSFDITVKATSKSTKLTETEKLHATFLAEDGTPTSSGSSSPTGSSGDPTSEVGSDGSNNGGGRLTTGDILLATIIPILFIALVVLLMVCFLKRRRARRTSDNSVYHKKVSSPVPGSFRVEKSATSIEEAERALVDEKKTGAVVYTNVAPVSPVSTARPRSSATLGNASIEHDYIHDNVSPTIRGLSRQESNNNRQSWETVEGDIPVMSGGKSMDYEVTEGVVPMAPPSMPSASPRRANNYTPPKLRDYPQLQPPTMAAFKQPPTHSYKSVDVYSSITTSSAALPANLSTYTSPVKTIGSTLAESHASGPNWEALSTSSSAESRLGELQRPQMAVLSAKTTGDLRTWNSGLQSIESRSIVADASFGSSENWRVIGKRDNTGLSYDELVEDSPYHPARPSTANPDRSSSLDLLSPSKWGATPRRNDDMPEKMGIPQSISALSREWRKEDSGKLSDGSFKVFL